MHSIAVIKNHFQRVDPVMAGVINQMPLQLVQPLPPQTYFKKLCEAIIGQQLAGKAADAIVARFTKLLEDQVKSKSVLETNDQALRDVGMSWAKVKSLKDLARHVDQQRINLDSLQNMDDDQVITELIKVKGIGQWTAEMFLMFTLGREDVFSHGDLGLRKGIAKLYGFANKPTAEQIEKIVCQWTPYKTYASLALWHVND